MGQYYIAALFEPSKKISKETCIGVVEAQGYYDGNKLTEHSYFGNPVVETVTSALLRHGKARVAWVGDYADKIRRRGKEYSLYHAIEYNSRIERGCGTPKMRWMLNHSKREWLDLGAYPRTYNVDKFFLNAKDEIVTERATENMLHPLPLLTCMGNYRGGGDYYPKFAPSDTLDYVGVWAGDIISLSNDLPDADWTEIRPRFHHPTYDLITDLLKKARNSIEYVK